MALYYNHKNIYLKHFLRDKVITVTSAKKPVLLTKTGFFASGLERVMHLNCGDNLLLAAGKLAIWTTKSDLFSCEWKSAEHGLEQIPNWSRGQTCEVSENLAGLTP